MAKRGRPSKFTPEIAATICERLASGQTLRQVCRDDDMPSEVTVRTWALDDYQGFSAQYTRAREIGYMVMADELMEIADDGTNDYVNRDGERSADTEHLGRSRLRVDTRKWMLSKMLPKIYGDKIDHNVKASFNVTLSNDDADL